MDDQFTEPPWSADVAGLIYAVNGRPGQTAVATLLDGAPAELLAAAPDLLRALEDSMDCLDQELGKLGGARYISVLEARNNADTAIIRATKSGYPSSTKLERLWTVNPDLPAAERKANARLLDASSDLLEAAKRAYAALAGHVDNAEVVDALQRAMIRATP